MATPTVVELAAFTGRTVTPEQGAAVLQVANSQVRAYVRGVGYVDGEPNDELGSVVLTLAAGYLAHPRQISMEESEGPASVSYRSNPGFFSAAEMFTMNRYRMRAL